MGAIMIFRKPLSRKAMFLLLCAAVLLVYALVASWKTPLGPNGTPKEFLDSVASDLGKNPLVSVVRVDHDARQIIVNVKPRNKTLTFTVTKAEPKALPGGKVGEEWEFDWKDETGQVLAFGHGLGTRTQGIHVDVPGLP